MPRSAGPVFLHEPRAWRLVDWTHVPAVRSACSADCTSNCTPNCLCLGTPFPHPASIAWRGSRRVRNRARATSPGSRGDSRTSRLSTGALGEAAPGCRSRPPACGGGKRARTGVTRSCGWVLEATGAQVGAHRRGPGRRISGHRLLGRAFPALTIVPRRSYKEMGSGSLVLRRRHRDPAIAARRRGRPLVERHVSAM